MPERYRIFPSGRVSAELKALYQRANEAGFRIPFLEALKRLETTLSLYPQWGEKLRDLATPGEASYAAAFPPLFVEYIVDEPPAAPFVSFPSRHCPTAASNSPRP
jgi:hypothetical protein